MYAESLYKPRSSSSLFPWLQTKVRYQISFFPTFIYILIQHCVRHQFYYDFSFGPRRIYFMSAKFVISFLASINFRTSIANGFNALMMISAAAEIMFVC